MKLSFGAFIMCFGVAGSLGNYVAYHIKSSIKYHYRANVFYYPYSAKAPVHNL